MVEAYGISANTNFAPILHMHVISFNSYFDLYLACTQLLKTKATEQNMVWLLILVNQTRLTAGKYLSIEY
jgi:hypothetical protein